MKTLSTKNLFLFILVLNGAYCGPNQQKTNKSKAAIPTNTDDCNEVSEQSESQDLDALTKTQAADADLNNNTHAGSVQLRAANTGSTASTSAGSPSSSSSSTNSNSNSNSGSSSSNSGNSNSNSGSSSSNSGNSNSNSSSNSDLEGNSSASALSKTTIIKAAEAEKKEAEIAAKKAAEATDKAAEWVKKAAEANSIELAVKKATSVPYLQKKEIEILKNYVEVLCKEIEQTLPLELSNAKKAQTQAAAESIRYKYRYLDDMLQKAIIKADNILREDKVKSKITDAAKQIPAIQKAVDGLNDARNSRRLVIKLAQDTTKKLELLKPEIEEFLTKFSLELDIKASKFF